MAILRKVRLGFQCIVVCLLAILNSNLSTALKWKSVELSDCLSNTNGSANGSCIFNDPQMKVIYATQNEIISIESQGKEVKVLKTNPSGSPRFVTTNARKNSVFWSDYADYEEAVYKTVFDSKSEEIANVFVDSNVYTPAGVAFDWITGNLYIVDTNLTHIAICAQDPIRCNVIFRDHSTRPVDIALHPNEGIMFWTDIGPNGGIRKSAMDGSATEIIVAASSDNLHHGIGIDEHDSRIYWTDLQTEQIESSKFDGSDRKTIKTSVSAFDVEIIGDWIFWSDSKTRKIMSANKLTGANETEIVSEHSATTLAGFSIMHPAMQPILRTNPCENLECPHICVLINSREAECPCPEGMLSNLTHCYTNINEPTLILAHKNKLLMMQLDTVGDDVFMEIRLPAQITEISAFVGNPINLTLILSDSKLKQIVEFTPSIEQPSNYWVLVEGTVNVTHISIDVVGENMIWIDQGKGTLEVMSLQTRQKTVVLTNMTNVDDIYFSSDLMALLLSKTGDNGNEKIIKVVLGSKTRQTSFQTYDQYTSPIKLSYDPTNKDIYFAVGNETDLIIHGFSNDSSEFIVGTFPGGTATDFVVIRHKIFWVDNTLNLRVLTSNGVEWCQHKISIDDSSKYDFSGEKLLTLLDKNMEHLDHLRANHDCSSINANGKKCEHICLSVGVGMLGECSCASGYDLGYDRLSCIKKSEISYLPIKVRKPVEKKNKKDQTVSNGLWVMMTVVITVLGSTITCLVVYWWKTSKLPAIITVPYAHFSRT